MKLTKFTIYFLLLATLFFIPSCNDEYDDSELTERVDNLENKVQKLEEQMNSNINSLQAIIMDKMDTHHKSELSKIQMKFTIGLLMVNG